jgi:peptidyl-prolyl cis-trans isomerase SurA
MIYKKILLFVIIFQITIFNFTKANVKIVTFVDNEIITNIDIKKESEYLKLLNPQLENLDKKKILELSKISLINEIIKKKEISKLIDINSKDNQLTNDQLKNIISKLEFTEENDFIEILKKRETYSINEVKDKIDIELYWNEIIFKRFSNLIKIDEKKLKKKISDIKDQKQKKFNLSEIVFRLDKNEKFDNKVKIINSSISEIGFQNTANIFSISESSKFGGKLGWIYESSLSKEILENIVFLNKDDISKVIKISNNYFILKINDIEIEQFILDEDKELKKLIQIEQNNQLNQFSRNFFNKLKMNYLIDER